jgi:acetyl-CoA carboxylase biotin carboxyl carrier protein
LRNGEHKSTGGENHDGKALDRPADSPLLSAPLFTGKALTEAKNLELKDIKDLIALMRKNDLSVFKMEKDGFKITLKRGSDFQPIITTSTPVALPAGVSVATPAIPASTEAAAAAASGASESNLKEITSPMVGTFYAAPSPEAPAYVKVGDTISEGAVVCIIEAMKVMNEIKAEVGGTVVEIAAENGKPVQFGQTLFRLK